MTTDIDTNVSATRALADHLMDVRERRAEPVASLVPMLIPSDEQKAYAVQDEIVRRLGSVVGWKVGARSPDAEPSAAPLHRETVFQNGAIIPAGLCRHRGVEAEIAWCFARTPELKPENLMRESVLDAIGSVHPVIELVDTRFRETGSQHPLAHLADQQNHGALIVGPALRDWRTYDSNLETITVRIDHRKSVTRPGINAAGDPLRLLVWLARHAAQRGLPLESGTIVTTGSLTGTLFVPHRTHVSAEFSMSGRVSAFLA